MKKRLFLVSWNVSGKSIVSGRDEEDIKKQFEGFDPGDFKGDEAEGLKIVKIEEYQKPDKGR